MASIAGDKLGSNARVAAQRAGKEPRHLAFVLYCLFIVSFFLHLGNRVPALGAIRIDILLTGIALLNIMFSKPTRHGAPRSVLRTESKLILGLFLYVFLTLPIVKWPGSVVDHGLDPFIKAICFYVLTVATVTSENRLKWFIVVFVGVQAFRVFEPLFLHITTGYWGSFTSMGNWEYMDRLSGAPLDIINPNGLAFVILVVLSLIHHLLIKGDRRQKLLYLALLAPLLYAMMLTGSRSGVLVLVLFALMQIWRSKHRVVALSVVAAIVIVLVAGMSDMARQRYLSIVDKNAKGAGTAQGRIDGLWTDLKVGLERPLVGHGLGTSAEANFNAYGEARPSHTLYTEVLQELGFIGLAIFLGLIYSTYRNCAQAVRDSHADPNSYLHKCSLGARDFFILLVVFSVASYGLNEYQWYLLAGLSVVLSRLTAANFTTSDAPAPAGSRLSHLLRRRPPALRART